MSNYNLLLDYYRSENVNPATYTGRVYALIFNREHEAINFDTSVPWSFSAYNKTEHDSFIRTLIEHNQRTKYWFDTVNCTALDIPNNPYGEQYVIEIWAEQVSGTFDRDSDILLQTKEFTWADGVVHESRIDISREENIALLSAAKVFSQSDSHIKAAAAGTVGRYFASELPLSISGNIFGIAASGFNDINTIGGRINDIYTRIQNVGEVNWIVHLGVSYDHSENNIQFMSWLEKDGEVYDNPDSWNIIMIDSEENVIASISSSDFLSGAFSGFIVKQLNGVELNPDETYAAVVTITDNEDPQVDHTSGAAPITWD